MNSVKILHTADCHLGSGRVSLSGSMRGGREELVGTFFKIISLCRENAADFLLIAGDLFDTPFADDGLVSDVCGGFSKIPGTQVIIAAGNHDCACPGSVYTRCSFPDNVTVFTSFAEYRDFPEKNVRIYGAGFTDKSEKIPLLNNFAVTDKDKINIGVLHGDLSGSPQASSYNPISTAQIAASGLDYLALGHIHKRSPIEKYSSTYCSYCGCPDGRGFDEEGSRGVYIGSVGKNLCALDYYELSSRIYAAESIDVSDCASAVAVADKISGLLRGKYGNDCTKNLYRISMTGTVGSDAFLNTERVRALLESCGIECNVTDRTEPDFKDIAGIASEETLRGAFVKKMLQKIDDAPSDRREMLYSALLTGLKAFDGEVKLLDN